MSLHVEIVVHPPAVVVEQRFWVRIAHTSAWSLLFEWVAGSIGVPEPSLRFLEDGIRLSRGDVVATLFEGLDEAEELPHRVTVDVVANPTPRVVIKAGYPMGRDL
jgi:hypothetical protein